MSIVSNYNIRSDNLPSWYPLFNNTTLTFIDLDNVFVLSTDSKFSPLDSITYTNQYIAAETPLQYIAQKNYFNGAFNPTELDEYTYGSTPSNMSGQLRGAVLSFARNFSTLSSSQFSATTPTMGTVTLTRSNSALTVKASAATAGFVGPVQETTSTYDKSKFSDNAIPFFTIIELIGAGGGGGCGQSKAFQPHLAGGGGGGGGYLAFVADWRPLNNKQISSIVISSGAGGKGGTDNGNGGQNGGSTGATIKYTDGSSVYVAAGGGGAGKAASGIDDSNTGGTGGGVEGTDKLVASNNLYLLTSASGGNGGRGATRHRIDLNGFNIQPTNGGSTSASISLVTNTSNNSLKRVHSSKSGGPHGGTGSGHIPGGGGGASVISVGAPGYQLDGPYALGQLVIDINGGVGAGGGGTGALASDDAQAGNGGSGGFYLWC